MLVGVQGPLGVCVGGGGGGRILDGMSAGGPSMIIHVAENMGEKLGCFGNSED